MPEPTRREPLKRKALPPRKAPIKRGEPPKRTRVARVKAEPGKTAKPRKAIPAKSKKRIAHDVVRSALVRKMKQERPTCEACPVWARVDGRVAYLVRPTVDIHEIVTRGRGGSALREDNCLPVCRVCHDRIDYQGNLAAKNGLVLHSWERDDPLSLGRAAARRQGSDSGLDGTV